MALARAFPAGVAMSAKAASRAVADGMRRPRVSAATYSANIRLDRDSDGVVCEKKAPAATPTPTPAPTPTPTPAGVFYAPTGIASIDTLYGEQAKNGSLTSAQAMFPFLWAHVLGDLEEQDWRYLCGNWNSLVFRDELVNTVMDANMLTAWNLADQEAWAKEAGKTVTTLFCVNRGYAYTA